MIQFPQDIFAKKNITKKHNIYFPILYQLKYFG